MSVTLAWRPFLHWQCPSKVGRQGFLAVPGPLLLVALPRSCRRRTRLQKRISHIVAGPFSERSTPIAVTKRLIWKGLPRSAQCLLVCGSHTSTTSNQCNTFALFWFVFIHECKYRRRMSFHCRILIHFDSENALTHHYGTCTFLISYT